MAAQLTITTFGGLQIRIGDRPVVGLASRKAEALLIVLACTRRPHSRETLGDLLWDERSAARARGNLTVLLASLRKELGAFIGADRQRVWLNLDAPVWLDAAVLEAAAAPLADPGAPPPTADQRAQIERALALYQGDFLHGFALRDCAGFEEWALAEQQRLGQLAALAHRALLAAARGQAEHSAAIGHAQALLQLEPYDEQAHRQLLELLVATGQRSAALAHYERLRQLLADDLGLAPAEEITALYQRIRLGDLAPGAARLAPPPSAPRPAPQLRGAPAQPLPFVGRESELAQVTQRLSDPACRLLTIIGPGGIGKTRFALQAARLHSATRADGAVFVSLAAVAEPARIAPAIASAIGIVLSPFSDPLAQLLAYLAERNLLLVLDNCEHLVEGMAIANTVLERAPQITILATSRERLRLRAEYLFELHGLPVPDSSAAEAARSSAVRLFAQHAEQLSNRFALDTETLPAVVQICRLVDGMPLAIELAAGRIRSATCDQIATQIARNLDALESDLRDATPRHRSVRAVFDYSWNLLSLPERAALIRLAVFAGGCTTAAAQAVGEISAGLLAALAEKSLVRRAGDQRYDLHELLRQFALERLMQAPEAQLAWARHSRYYLQLISGSAADLSGREPHLVVAALHLERDNLRQAWERAVELELFDGIARALLGMSRWYSVSGNVREGVQAFEAALIQLGSQPMLTPELRDLQTRLLIEQAELFNRQGIYAEGQQRAERALQAGVDVGSAELIALACYRAGEAVTGIGAYADARPLLERSLALVQSAGLSEFEPMVRRQLGILSIYQGQIEQAGQHYAIALEGFRALGDVRGEADVLNNIGVLTFERGQAAQALPYYEQSIALQRAINNRIGEGVVLNNMATIIVGEGRYDEVCDLLERALVIYRETGDQQSEAIALLNLGDTFRVLGDVRRASQLIEQALAIWRENSNQIDQSFAYTALSQLSVDLGRYDEARSMIEESIQIASTLGSDSQHADALTVLGRIHTHHQRYDAAIAAFEEAIVKREDLAQNEWVLDSYGALAVTLIHHDQAERAGRIARDTLLPRLRIGPPNINEPLPVYWACYQALRAVEDPQADWVLDRAASILDAWAAEIQDPELRRMYLDQATNRLIRAAAALRHPAA